MPTAVSALSDKGVVYLAAGGNHCAAVTEEGALYTWGRGSYGRLGHGKFVYEAVHVYMYLHCMCMHIMVRGAT